jgi:hypothetical protein
LVDDFRRFLAVDVHVVHEDLPHRGKAVCRREDASNEGVAALREGQRHGSVVGVPELRHGLLKGAENLNGEKLCKVFKLVELHSCVLEVQDDN